MFYSDIHENIHTVINVDESKYGRKGEEGNETVFLSIWKDSSVVESLTLFWIYEESDFTVENVSFL